MTYRSKKQKTLVGSSLIVAVIASIVEIFFPGLLGDITSTLLR
jgi:hypothetical protein